MTEAELMEAVWADPACPVELAGPNAMYPHGDPIPWPRERVDIPHGQGRDVLGKFVWRYHCLCRSPRSLESYPDLHDIPKRHHWPNVVMRGRAWLENSDSPRTWIVYLGQCGDCGRIYWSAV